MGLRCLWGSLIVQKPFQIHLTLSIQKGKYSNTPPPAQRWAQDRVFFNVSKRKRRTVRRAINIRYPDENQYRWMKQTIRTAGTRHSLGEYGGNFFGLFLYFQKNALMSNEGTEVENVRMWTVKKQWKEKEQGRVRACTWEPVSKQELATLFSFRNEQNIWKWERTKKSGGSILLPLIIFFYPEVCWAVYVSLMSMWPRAPTEHNAHEGKDDIHLPRFWPSWPCAVPGRAGTMDYHDPLPSCSTKSRQSLNFSQHWTPLLWKEGQGYVRDSGHGISINWSIHNCVYGFLVKDTLFNRDCWSINIKLTANRTKTHAWMKLIQHFLHKAHHRLVVLKWPKQHFMFRVHFKANTKI